MARTPIDRRRLLKYVESGLTQEQMPAAFHADTGEWRARASFASAMRRLGVAPLPERQKPRYKEMLPWRVAMQHTNSHTARMLRNLARRDAGGILPPDEGAKLDAFLRGLDDDDAVIHYDRDTEEGFWRVPREPGDHGYVRVTTDLTG